MMKKFISLAACFLVLAAFAVAARAQPESGDWTGAYQFSEDGGRTVGGTAIFVAHDLKIVRTDDGLVAYLESSGYQTSRDLVARAAPQGDRLLLYFESYGENNVFETYREGDLLLTLERRKIKGKPVILTFWNKFLPIVPKNEKSGQVYFQKTDGEEIQ